VGSGRSQATNVPSESSQRHPRIVRLLRTACSRRERLAGSDEDRVRERISDAEGTARPEAVLVPVEAAVLPDERDVVVVVPVDRPLGGECGGLPVGPLVGQPGSDLRRVERGERRRPGR